MRLKPKTAGLVLILAVLGTFLPALHNQFVDYDDPEYVSANVRVQQGISWQGILWAFRTGQAANWHPVTWLSHMLDCQLFGLSPFGHHMTSVLIHAVNTLLVFLVLHRLTKVCWQSFFIAALFGLHPLRVQSVAWVSERKDVLCGLFWLLTLLVYIRYVEVSREPSGPRGKRMAWTWYGVALVCFALGLMSKPMIVTLPFVLLLLDYWPLGRLGDLREVKTAETGSKRSVEPGKRAESSNKPKLLRCVLEKIPFLLLAAGASLATFLIQNRAGAVVQTYPFGARVANALVSYCRYVGKTFWPIDLAIFYPPMDWQPMIVLLAGVFLAGITACAFLSARRLPWLLTGWLWFVGVLVPVIGLVQAGEQSMADRYTYIPSIGLFLCVVYALWAAMPERRQALAISVLAGLALVCIVRTRHEIKFWNNTETLFTHAVQVTEKNYLAHSSLGTELEKQGRLDEAASHLETALALRPAYAEAHNNLGVVRTKQGRLAEALGEFTKAIQLKPNYANPHNNLGLVAEKSGRLEEAIVHYHAALKLNPEFADAYYNLGIAQGRLGNVDEAIRQFETALRFQPNSADIHNNLAVVLARKGDLAGAIQHYQQALQINPEYATAHFNLGVALVSAGQLDQAIVEFQEALRLRPGYVEAEKNLAALLANRQGQK